MKTKLTVFDILSIANATSLKSLLKRVYVKELERTDLPLWVRASLEMSLENQTSVYLYENERSFGVFKNYETALRFVLKKHIQDVNFLE